MSNKYSTSVQSLVTFNKDGIRALADLSDPDTMPWFHMVCGYNTTKDNCRQSVITRDGVTYYFWHPAMVYFPGSSLKRFSSPEQSVISKAIKRYVSKLQCENQ